MRSMTPPGGEVYLGVSIQLQKEFSIQLCIRSEKETLVFREAANNHGPKF